MQDKINCWLNIYKPRGISSAKVVGIVKRRVYPNKVGHCGTLDVEAEGILPIAIGEATKLTQFLVSARKQYEFTIQFGQQTDTADATGQVIATTNHLPLEFECFDVCSKFHGIINQRPPSFSAIKINGVRSYKLARKGEMISLPERNIEIFSLKCLSTNAISATATYLVECSKGTYVRTLAEDIALSLQSLGFVLELRRICVGQFLESDSLALSQLDYIDNVDILQFIADNGIRLDLVLDDIPALDADLEQVQKIRYGQSCFFDCTNNLSSVWIRYQGNLVAIGAVKDRLFEIGRVFNL